MSIFRNIIKKNIEMSAQMQFKRCLINANNTNTFGNVRALIPSNINVIKKCTYHNNINNDHNKKIQSDVSNIMEKFNKTKKIIMACAKSTMYYAAYTSAFFVLFNVMIAGVICVPILFKAIIDLNFKILINIATVLFAIYFKIILLF